LKVDIRWYKKHAIDLGWNVRSSSFLLMSVMHTLTFASEMEPGFQPFAVKRIILYTVRVHSTMSRTHRTDRDLLILDNLLSFMNATLCIFASYPPPHTHQTTTALPETELSALINEVDAEEMEQQTPEDIIRECPGEREKRIQSQSKTQPHP